MSKASREEVYESLDSERDYQMSKWNGAMDRIRPIESWILYMEHHLELARKAVSTILGEDPVEAFHQVRKVTALGVAALEYCGAPTRKEEEDGKAKKV